MKTFKVFFLFVGLMGMMNSAFAQKEDWGTDSLECRKCLSLYTEPLKQKNYEEAATHWRCVVAVCPKYKESIYINGAIIYRNLIDVEKDAPKKEKLIDSLAWIYEKRMEYFGRSTEALEAYGNDMIRYRQSNPAVANKVLIELIDREKGNSSCVALMRYYQSLILMYRKKEAGVDNAKMMEEYFRIKEYLAESSAANPNDKNCTIANEEVDKYGTPFLPCDKIYEYADKKYNEVPKDNKELRLTQMKKLLDIMNKRNCNDNEVYDKVLSEVLEAEPSADGYYSLGMSLNNKRKFADANNNFKKAIEMCGECEKLGDYLIGAAQANLNAGNASTAASYARQAMAKDPQTAGKANYIIGQAVVMSGCGNNEFERKFLYVLAVEYMQKAKAADGSLANDANAKIGAYRSRYPNKTEIFEWGLLDKETFQIGCWINESVRIPKE